MKEIEFAVFHHADEGRIRWSAYSMWFSPAWAGFVGKFKGKGETRRLAMRDAIDQAKRAKEESKK